MIDVSVILVNFNTAQLTLDCLKSILSITDDSTSYEIIIIDNASDYEDYLILKKSSLVIDDDRIMLFREKKNLGFGGGNMRGVHHASGKFYAFVNNDVVLENDCLTILKTFLEHNAAAVAGATQLDHLGNIKKSFDYFLTIKRELIGRSLLHKIQPKKYPNRKSVYSSPIKVDCVPGSLMMVRAKHFQLVGGFDTNQFLYFEESDLCSRILQLPEDSSCYHVPEAKYTHYSGSSTGKNIRIEQELKLSRMYTLKKHSHPLSFLFFYIYELILHLFKAILSSKARRALKLYLTGFPLHQSLKQKQIIHER